MFLKDISNEIIRTHGNNLARIAIIFPNKRASLWMNDFLLEAAGGKDVFAPQYFSISEFFQKHSDLVLADHIQLVSILHKSYCKITGEKQSLDQFYAWGEILLSDFDNVDKSLADAEDLFRNISDIHEMDTIDYLNDEQKALLERFFNAFTRDHESKIRQKFIALWNHLLDIYTDFKDTLTSQHIAYEGMLYRDVVERISSDDFTLDHYYAIGFNQLLKCEEKLFLCLSGKFSMKNDEASIKTVCPDAKITIIQSLTDDLQTRYIEHWLKENNRIKDDRRTAIVLCDEHLLPSAVYGLPNEAETVNITAGFPLSETQPASYVATLLELLTEGLTKDRLNFRTAYRRNLEGHPMYKYAAEAFKENMSAKDLCSSVSSILSFLEKSISCLAINARKEGLIAVVKKEEEKAEEKAKEKAKQNGNGLMAEAIFRVYNIVNRLKTLHNSGYLDIEPVTLARLFKQILLTMTVPLHGEPAKGIQIMGVLETRNLDFDHILMLSCNEGIMPKGGSDASTIPYAIKKAFELNTSDDRTNIFAYYFYRLLKRCKDVTLVYNASGNETSPGEMSRFLLNLIVNNSDQINRTSLQTDFQSHTKQPQSQSITSSELHDFIESKRHGYLSPTAINKYMGCEKSFYYQYYRNLREEKDEEDEMDAETFGSFFHSAAEDFYTKFIGKTITKDMLERYVKKPALLEPHINKALDETRKKVYGDNVPFETSGMELLLKSVVRKNLERLLKNDMKFCPFTIVSLESKHYKKFSVDTAEGNISLSIGGIVDRLDRITTDDGKEILRVVDYKTGTDHSDIGKKPQKKKDGEDNTTKIVEVADIFNNKILGSGYYRQTCLYSAAISNNSTTNPKHLPVAPALYYIRNKALGSTVKFDPIIKINGEQITDITSIEAEYESELLKVLQQMFSKLTFDIPEDLTTCSKCPYAELCME